MKRLAVFTLLVCFLVLAPAWAAPEKPSDSSDGFAVYLLKDSSITGVKALEKNLADLELQAQPLFTGRDMVDYRWSDHSFSLKPEAKAKLPGGPGVSSVFGVPFVVMANGKRMYLGAFWWYGSSQSFPNPVILPPSKKDNIFRIERDYHGLSDGDNTPDPRPNPIIRAALARETKLITTAEPSEKENSHRLSVIR
ncbi:MAG: hypothetical protein NT018_11575 [Armatimonadetes bacterium]|nr:hypothetical protein [Armatimonadota bacterium]